MRLIRVDIINFRSILQQSISIDRNFQLLVGINESGKTNIIRAFSFLNSAVHPTDDDIREIGYEEKEVTTSLVRFVCRLNNEQISAVEESISEDLLGGSLTTPICQKDGRKYSLSDLCRLKNEVLYNVNILKKKKFFSHWKMFSDMTILPGWKAVVADTAETVQIKEDTVTLSDYRIVHTDDVPQLPEGTITDMDADFLNKLIASHTLEVADDNLPPCIIWHYNDENLLPAKVNLPQFIAKPSTCIPLLNMFRLAGYRDTTKTLQEASKRTHGIKNVLKKVGINTTDHMRKVWPEWKKQRVVLNENGEFVDAGIEDEFNLYSLNKRSDGFKRFFTFLLMISVQSKTSHLCNNVIVIDEPDLGLHPSGVHYLREELCKIGDTNIVLASTHSIFMIDKEIIDRHLIVTKAKEITSATRASVSNITDEEVIYKALGFSLWSMLKPMNIIFEGWRDKKLFEVFIRSREGHKLISKEESTKLGFLYALGAKDIARVASVCDSFSRRYTIISDSDQAAKQRQSSFVGDGTWYCYTDIDGIHAQTTEDFLTGSFVEKALKKVLKSNGYSQEISIGDIPEVDKLKYIKERVANMAGLPVAAKDILNEFKEYCCLNAKYKDMETDYTVMARFILKQALK